MTTKLCKNCGHEKGSHRNLKYYCKRVRPIKCKCKKFDEEKQNE